MMPIALVGVVGGWRLLRHPRRDPVLSGLALQNPRARTRVVVGLAIGRSFLIQLSGAWFYPASLWNGRMGPNLERAAWNPRHFMPWEDFVAWWHQRPAARPRG